MPLFPGNDQGGALLRETMDFSCIIQLHLSPVEKSQMQNRKLCSETILISGLIPIQRVPHTHTQKNTRELYKHKKAKSFQAQSRANVTRDLSDCGCRFHSRNISYVCCILNREIQKMSKRGSPVHSRNPWIACGGNICTSSGVNYSSILLH